MLFEKTYAETDNGKIEETYTYRGEELAKKSDVYAHYLKARAYTDEVDTRSRVAIGVSIINIVISLVLIAVRVFI